MILNLAALPLAYTGRATRSHDDRPVTIETDVLVAVKAGVDQEQSTGIGVRAVVITLNFIHALDRPPGFEPSPVDSESTMLPITPGAKAGVALHCCKITPNSF